MSSIEELDPTTARLVSELATQMLPSLTKALNSAVPSDQIANFSAGFTTAIERTNRISQDLRTHIEKSIRASIDDSRAGRSMMMQSIASMLEEVTSLKRLLEKIPEQLASVEKIIKTLSETPNANEITNESISIELAGIKEILGELITGLQTFSETQSKASKTGTQENIIQDSSGNAKNFSENDAKLEKIINSSFPGLEGLVKAQGKTQSKELEELSREIASLQEENNIALIHEIREAVNEELASFMNNFDISKTKQPGSSLTTKILAAMSGTCIIFMGVIIYLLLR